MDEPTRKNPWPKIHIHAPDIAARNVTLEVDGYPLSGVRRVFFDVAAGQLEPVTVRLELVAEVEINAEAARILADAGAEFVPPKDADSIKAVNQAAAYLQGILALPPAERDAVAAKLFAIAGNPLPVSDEKPSSAEDYYRFREAQLRSVDL